MSAAGGVRAFDSAYPGSMFERKDGAYVEREDAASLAGALLETIADLRRQLEDANDALSRYRGSAAPAGGGDELPKDATNLEVIRHFLTMAREMKPVGQWPGERVCLAIERVVFGPRDFIAREDMAPERGHNGRGGDAPQPLPPFRGPTRFFDAASAGSAPAPSALINAVNAYRSECENPAPDYVMRNLRRKEMFALAAAPTPETQASEGGGAS